MRGGAAQRLCIVLLGAALGTGACVGQYPMPQPPMPPGQGPMHPYGGHGFGMHEEGVHILPPGLWWKDQDLVQRLELTPDQQKHIDEIFAQNRVVLSRLHSSLDDEQQQLRPMLDANPVDEAKVMAEVGKLADMRAELFKATSKMLLEMRNVLSQQQWTKLQQERPGRMRQHMYMRGQDGP